MKQPRLIYYNDAHHYHAKRVEPPVSRHKLKQPVDELLGTGVDLLVLGLGYGDVYFHNSKIGRTVGEKKEVWESFIDWRIMRMVKDAHQMGTDQVREVIQRGRETGLRVMPSLKLQDPTPPGEERCGWLKWEHGAEVCLRESDDRLPHTEWCYDYTLEQVRDEKMALIREMLEDYRAEGIELDFMFRPRYFRRAEVEENIPLMNGFVAQIGEMARKIGRAQDREIPIAARVFHQREENLKFGLDVEAWFREGSIDYVVGQVGHELLETGLEARWLAEAARSGDGAAYIRPPNLVYDERTAFPDIEMWRALGQNLHEQGFAGLYVGYFPWPLDEREYQVLREIAYPEVISRRNKRYLLQPREADETYTPPPKRQLPMQLEEGETAAVKIRVGDDLESARQDRELRAPILTLRFSFFCVEDEVEIRLNGTALAREEAEVTDERGLWIRGRFRRTLEAPEGMSAHWFRFKLDPELLKKGDNTVEVEVRRFDPTAGFVRSINGVEIQTRYKDFVRPEGLDVERIPLN